MKRLAPLALTLGLVACSRAPETPAAAAPVTAPPVTATTPAPTPAPATANAAPTASPEQAAGSGRAPLAPRADASAGRSEVPSDIPVSAANATTTAHREQPLGRAAVTVIETGAQFHVEVSVPLRDARLSLLDGDGAMVAAAGGAEIGSSWARFHLAPDAPLQPGSRYALKIDGAVERNPRDAEGRIYAPASWSLLTAGEKPKAEAKKQKHQRRRR